MSRPILPGFALTSRFIISIAGLFGMALVGGRAVASDSQPGSRSIARASAPGGLTVAPEVGLGMPDAADVSLLARYGHFGLRLFVSPPVPIDHKETVAGQELTDRRLVSVSNGAFAADFRGTYGPNYGLDLQFFPRKQGLFFALGIAQRTLSLRSSADVPVTASTPLLRNLAGTANVPTELEVSDQAWLARAGAGWQAPLTGHVFVTATIGVAAVVGDNGRVQVSGDGLLGSELSQTVATNRVDQELNRSTGGGDNYVPIAEAAVAYRF